MSDHLLYVCEIYNSTKAAVKEFSNVRRSHLSVWNYVSESSVDSKGEITCHEIPHQQNYALLKIFQWKRRRQQLWSDYSQSVMNLEEKLGRLQARTPGWNFVKPFHNYLLATFQFIHKCNHGSWTDGLLAPKRTWLRPSLTASTPWVKTGWHP